MSQPLQRSRWAITLLLALLLPAFCRAQESEQVFIQGKRYLDLNIHSLDKYAKRLERTQKQLLAKLKRKEQRLAKKLLRTDSAAYARLRANPLTYDSIAKLAAHPDSATVAAKALRGGQRAVDSLKGVYNFLQGKAGQLGGAAGSLSSAGGNAGNVLGTAGINTSGLEGYSSELSSLQGRLSYDQYISGLIDSRGSSLTSITRNSSAVTGIQKELYYAKAKMGEWKKMAEEPSRLEDLALEYLQGTKGFDGSMDKAVNGVGSSNGGTSMTGAASADELEKMGFQTKRQVNAALQQKFGSSLQSVQASAGKDISQWQSKAQGLGSDLKQTKQSLAGLRHTEKPKFKINPMRGLPFWKRVEKQYGFNATRATLNPDGTPRPAILTLSVGAAYKQTPKLSAGIGLSADIGLGQSWSNIRFSFEGVGARAFVQWQWQYGIGAYGGYERTWKEAAFSNAPQEQSAGTAPAASVHSTAHYSEAVLLGLTKSYKINSKWNGQIQVLYDAWWMDKGLRSPVIIRFINAK